MLTALRQRRIVGFDTVDGVCWRQVEATLGLCDISSTKNLRNSKENHFAGIASWPWSLNQHLCGATF